MELKNNKSLRNEAWKATKRLLNCKKEVISVFRVRINERKERWKVIVQREIIMEILLRGTRFPELAA